MGVREGSASFVEVAGGILGKSEQTPASAHGDLPGPDGKGKTRAEWLPILAFVGIMAVPFALVAWLMS
jgi:hypothetical protein